MKKSLIALAVLGAFATVAQAQTNVQLGGRIQANLKSYKVGNVTQAGRVAENELRIDDDETSRFWLRGTEDLGGGLKALFYVENRFNTDVSAATPGSGNGLANGDTYLGLAGNWGQITAGKHTFMDSQGSAVQFGIQGGQALPTSFQSHKTILNYVDGSGAGAVVGINTGRTSNSVQYLSPKFGGFQGTVGFSTASNENEGVIGSQAAGVPAADYEKGRAYFLAGNYSNGPIYLNLAYWDNEREGTGVQNDQIRLSGSYAFPFGLKAGFQWDRANIEALGGAERKRNAWQIPVTYQFGPSTVMASFTKAGDVSGEADSGAKFWTVGYDYALSKRTNVGLFFAKLDNDANASYQPNSSGTSQNGSVLLNGESAKILALTIKHTF